MNALASYLRHIIVTGILIAVDKIGLPIEGASAAADIIALAVVGTVSWWVVKYLAPKIKMPKSGGTALLLLCGVLVLVLPSCSQLSQLSGTINVPLPERLGGGTIPITIHPAK